MPVDDAPMSNILQGAALVSLIWSSAVFLVQTIGIYKLFRHHSRPLAPPISPTLPEDEVPHITIIRPAKGLEIGLYECLASTFQQAYPASKLTIYLCVASAEDPAYPVLQKLLTDFPHIDAAVLVEEDDPLLHGAGGHVNNLGPNPKIRNISRAYREAKGDVIWIVDCNVWVGKGAAGRMVDKLYGFQANGAKPKKPYKFVHQLPFVVDMETSSTSSEEGQTLLSPSRRGESQLDSLMGRGGRLEQMFMATSHAKFYSAINTVGIAPCIVGKSNMFRKSHLERFTDPSQNPILSAWEASRGRGIDFFSSYICEDHLIGDLIFKSKAPGYLNHGLVFGDVAIQPMSGMSIAAYIARRVRWLRVRKWTVLLATLVEPGVESLLCCVHFSFALTTLPWFHEHLGISQTWKAMSALWLFAVTIWMLLDRCVTSRLYECRSVDVDENTPPFARGTFRQGGTRAPSFLQWLPAWLGRELLALPIWTWAVLLGTTVSWRGRRFRVRMDMSVVEITDGKSRHDDFRLPSSMTTGSVEADTPRSRSKDRIE
ncbi:glycosyltransferase family 21 protein [Apodospora peruviana]|uniref:Ceramide glucosyltransferase n=1 Tax=Apodospora peruviana TaxID=516989 RepID=A0AAE0IJC6_9PEZI|nr:glycosyltransferase family 21 protein [Apodospora peruviana]